MIMREKHLWKLASMLIAVLMGLAMVWSCSKDDEDGGGQNSDGSPQAKVMVKDHLHKMLW